MAWMFGWFGKRRHECGSHGYGSETRICQHLVNGQRLGWFVRRDEDEPDAPWPDAWCASCNDSLVAAGERILQAISGLQFSSVCDECYERHRERNWPADSDEKLAALLDRARTEFVSVDCGFQTHESLARFDCFEWEKDSRRLVLSNRATRERIAATVQCVGSFSLKTHTWLWAWGQAGLDERDKRRLRDIRRYGEEYALLRLAVPHWSGTTRDAWDMTAIAGTFIPSEGLYRLPHANGHNYMLVLGVEALG